MFAGGSRQADGRRRMRKSCNRRRSSGGEREHIKSVSTSVDIARPWSKQDHSKSGTRPWSNTNTLVSCVELWAQGKDNKQSRSSAKTGRNWDGSQPTKLDASARGG